MSCLLPFFVCTSCTIFTLIIITGLTVTILLTVHTNLNLKADFALFHSVCTSRSSPHEGEASKSHWRCLEASFINCQTQIAVIYD